MPKIQGEKSNEADEQEKANSVYDFLYYDARRVGSFLAQFDVNGHLQGVKQTQGTNDTVGAKNTYTVKADVAVAGGAIARDESEAEAGARSAERQYDPLWTNALNFLDFLARRDLIQRDLSKARISQFVLAKGSLGVIDMTMIKEMWALPAFTALMSGAAQPPSPSKNDRNRRGNPRATRSTLTEQEIGLQILSIIPHSVQATLNGEEGQVWASLRQDGLIVSASDLFLKHGKSIPGEWHMLGIIDALPSEVSLPPVVPSDEIAVGIMGGLGYILDVIGPSSRMLLGRPDAAFGMTPLLIFRRVADEA